MTKLYTGCGDEGYTKKADGKEVSKSDICIKLVGTIDEASAILGVARAATKHQSLKEDIFLIQKNLISLMSEISGAGEYITQENINSLQGSCDKYCPKGLEKFLIPGENLSSAFLHYARTVARRAECIAAEEYHKSKINKNVLIYLNRLSDTLFAMASFAEKEE